MRWEGKGSFHEKKSNFDDTKVQGWKIPRVCQKGHWEEESMSRDVSEIALFNIKDAEKNQNN